MAQKKHDTQDIFNMLGAQETQEKATETAKAPKTAKKGTTKKPQGRPKKTQDEKKGGYRYNLNLDKELKEYLKNKAWQDRKTATDYINDLIRADMEAYFKNGGTKEGWIEIDD